jgi:hypothetical protein
MTAANKSDNDYRRLLSERFYADTPKAVLAAVLVSYLLRDGWMNTDPLALRRGLERAITDEWATLHANGIVPQKAPRTS